MSSVSRFQAQGVGILLFLFIPVVLFLFVRHPEPILASLAGGVTLMLGHRFLARPWMERVREAKCLWCNRMLNDGAGESFPLAVGETTVAARCCPQHRQPLERFFGWIAAVRRSLRVGIFFPLLLLLAGLALAVAGRPDYVADTTAFFQLAVGITVNVAAAGPLIGRADGVPRVPFPVHNFFLLGVNALLWIFRLVGAWWIVGGVRQMVEIAARG